MSPLLAAFIGGIIGGFVGTVASCLIVGLVVRRPRRTELPQLDLTEFDRPICRVGADELTLVSYTAGGNLLDAAEVVLTLRAPKPDLSKYGVR